MLQTAVKQYIRNLLWNVDTLGFRSLHIIAEASVIRKIIYIQILVKIFVIFLLRCLKPPIAFTQKTFCCLFLSQAITLELICGSDLFPLACPANAP